MVTRVRGNPPGPTAETVAANIKRVRLGRTMTQADLSARLGAIGRPIPTASVGKIETGLRAVEVDDLVAIAIALDVSPLGLLFPRGELDELVPITGGRISLGLLWQWALAEHSLEADDRAAAARSLPPWLTVQGDTEAKPGAVVHLSFGAGDSEPELHQTIKYTDRG